MLQDIAVLNPHHIHPDEPLLYSHAVVVDKLLAAKTVNIMVA